MYQTAGGVFMADQRINIVMIAGVMQFRLSVCLNLSLTSTRSIANACSFPLPFIILSRFPLRLDQFLSWRMYDLQDLQ